MIPQTSGCNLGSLRHFEVVVLDDVVDVLKLPVKVDVDEETDGSGPNGVYIYGYVYPG